MTTSLHKIFLLFILSISCSQAFAKPITVAVIDSGIDKKSNNKLCKFGHKNFLDNTSPLEDSGFHGTHIAGLIKQHAGKSNYCIVSLKFYDGKGGNSALNAMVKAINYAVNIKVNIINISAGGGEYSAAEHKALIRALKAGIKVVVAAGNDGYNLDYSCSYYPACYSDLKLTVVGNLMPAPKWSSAFVKDFKSIRHPTSNYGNYVNHWEIGTDVESSIPGGKGLSTGTSQAAAIATGKLIKSLKNK